MQRAAFLFVVLAVLPLAVGLGEGARAEDSAKQYDPETGRYVSVGGMAASGGGAPAPVAAEVPVRPESAAAPEVPVRPESAVAPEVPVRPEGAAAVSGVPVQPEGAVKVDAEDALLDDAVPSAPAAPTEAPSAGPEESVAGFNEVKSAPLFKQISGKFKDFTEKELYMILNRCVLAPDYLRGCRPFSCTQRETPDLVNDRSREVIGSYDGKCYYRETSKQNGKDKTVECELNRDQQKTLADEITADLQRLVKSDVLLEDGRRAAAKSVYASCIEREGNAGVLLAAKKNSDDEIARIRQAYKDKLAGLKSEKEQKEVIEAIRNYQSSRGKREELRKEVMDSTAVTETPSADAISRELAKQFPAPPKAEPQNLEQIEKEELALAASLEQLDIAEKSLPEDRRMPEELRAASAAVQARLRSERSKRAAPEALIIDKGAPPPLPEGIVNGAKAIGPDGQPVEAAGAEAPKFTLSVRNAGAGAAGASLSAVPGVVQGEPLQKRLYEAFDALMRGQLSASVTLYKGLLNDYPDNVDVLFGLASAYHKLGQKNQARPYYQRAVQLDPERADLMNNFLALLAEESPENALIELRKLQQISPDFTPVPAQIGLIYFQMKDYASAADAFGRAVKLDENNPHYLYNYAVALDKLMRKEEATYYYRKFLRSSLDAPPAANVSRDEISRRIAYLELNASSDEAARRRELPVGGTEIRPAAPLAPQGGGNPAPGGSSLAVPVPPLAEGQKGVIVPASAAVIQEAERRGGQQAASARVPASASGAGTMSGAFAKASVSDSTEGSVVQTGNVIAPPPAAQTGNVTAPVSVISPVAQAGSVLAPVSVIPPVAQAGSVLAPVSVIPPVAQAGNVTAPVPVVPPVAQAGNVTAPVPVVPPVAQAESVLAPVPVVPPVAQAGSVTAPVPVVPPVAQAGSVTAPVSAAQSGDSPSAAGSEGAAPTIAIGGGGATPSAKFNPASSASFGVETLSASGKP